MIPRITTRLYHPLRRLSSTVAEKTKGAQDGDKAHVNPLDRQAITELQNKHKTNLPDSFVDDLLTKMGDADK